MGTGEVLEYLESKKEPLRRLDIANALKIEPEKISKLLNRLLEQGFIECIEINHMQAMEKYGVKRRLRLFYCKQS